MKNKFINMSDPDNEQSGEPLVCSHVTSVVATVTEPNATTKAKILRQNILLSALAHTLSDCIQ